jgi:uncharacterized membrane protein
VLTWPVVIALAAGVFAQRCAGALFVNTDRLSPGARRVLNALPLAIIAGVVALTTLTEDGQLRLDARSAGVAAAAVCAWRKLPMFATVIAAAAVTALVRAAS